MLIQGGLFDSSDRTLESAFRYSIKTVQENRRILPRSFLSHPTNDGKGELIPPNDSFIASKKG